MQVSEFTPLSDYHRKISMKILSSFQREYNKENMTHFPERYKWNNLIGENFQKAFLHPAIQNDIKSFLNKSLYVSETGINNATYFHIKFLIR